MSRWVSSAINGIASLWGVHQQNKNIDKQLSAQAAENRKMREYNLMLAKQQNQWNLEQWNRENAYNSPSAQMERMRQAGLNLDMMYGGGVSGNLAASSPSMTSGSAAPPMDWSSLANKRTVGQAIMDSLAIDQARANVDKTKAEAEQLGMTNDVRQEMISKGMMIEEAEYDLLREQINLVFNQAREIDLTNTLKEIENDFANAYRDKIVENMLQRLETSTGMQKNALKEDIETLTMRIIGANAENSRLKRLSNFTTEEKQVVFNIIKEIINMLVFKKVPVK